MTVRARFGVDCDGVLYAFQKTAIYMLNTMRGYSLKEEDWTYWNWPKDNVTNNDWLWLWSGGVKAGLFRYGHLMKGSIEAVRALNVLGDVVIITHRPRHAVQDTLDWLAYLRLPFMEVHLLTEGQAKSSVAGCDLYVDDKPENCIDFNDHTEGLPLLWRRPWNTNFDCYSLRYSHEGIPLGPRTIRSSVSPVETWQEVIDYAQAVVAEKVIRG